MTTKGAWYANFDAIVFELLARSQQRRACNEHCHLRFHSARMA